MVELTAVRANEARKVLAVLEAKVLKMPESKLRNLFRILKRPFDVKISVDFKYASLMSVAIHVGHFFRANPSYIATCHHSNEQGSIKITCLIEKGKYSLLSWNYFIIQPH